MKRVAALFAEQLERCRRTIQIFLGFSVNAPYRSSYGNRISEEYVLIQIQRPFGREVDTETQTSRCYSIVAPLHFLVFGSIYIYYSFFQFAQG